ncbi:MAG: aldo/keto reductase [Henriciella sp.]
MNTPIDGLPLVLGGNVFGWTAKGDEGFAVLDAFYEAGGRMIDTADAYTKAMPGHSGGESETFIGQWLTSRGVRDEMKIHTKTGKLNPGDELYELSTVSSTIEESLNRLQTNHVDLYYAHADNTDVPIDQIVESMNTTVFAGKAHALGISNITLPRFKMALDAAARTSATKFSVLQNQMNLLEQDDFDPTYQQFCVEHGISMLPYFSLASGYLTGKYRTPGDFDKWMRGRMTKRYTENGKNVLAAMDAIATETGASLATIALAWLASQPGITSPIASARTVDQLEQLIDFTRLKLSEIQIKSLTEAAAQSPTASR